MAVHHQINDLRTGSAGRIRTISALQGSLVLVIAMVILVLFTAPSVAAPLDFNGIASLEFQGYFSKIEGRMGFDQEPGGIGTLNDLKDDLGLPGDNKTYRFKASIRPLEHHLLRLYGSIPETYKGGGTLKRQLRTRNTIYPAGTLISSELRTGMFGFGYDLDFLVGPTWFGGLHGDLRYVDLRVRMGNPGSGLEDTINIDELTPCLGAHMQARTPGLGCLLPGLSLGAYARITYAMTPNYFNYFDLWTGLSVTISPRGLMILDGKVGYEHESFFHNLENISGRILEFKRDGISFSVELTF
jgi:hypothetical protein